MTDASASPDGFEELEALSAEERRRLCDEVVRSLSDLVEGTADPELQARVERILGRCRPYCVVRDSLASTIRELRELGDRTADLPESDGVRRAIEEARRRLAARRAE